MNSMYLSESNHDIGLYIYIGIYIFLLCSFIGLIVVWGNILCENSPTHT